MNYGLAPNLKFDLLLDGCVLHKLLWATNNFHKNEENHSFVGNLNRPNGYHVLGRDNWILTKYRNVRMLVDPIQIIQMHRTIFEDGGCFGE